MARYRDRSRYQAYMLPVHLADQLQPGTFEPTIDYLVDNEIDLSGFDSRYENDESGAPAYDPAILLKVVLFAYSRGITSSRRIARACEEKVVFMALSADSRRCYSGSPRYCTVCEMRSKCIRGKKTQVKAVTIIGHSPRAIQKMIEGFDTDRGRHYYSRRMGTVEPVFANITCTYGLNRFSLRGREKVDAQWKPFCGRVRAPFTNIGKIAAHWRREKEG